ncbi:hypothetical protein EBR04_03315, partial [bacterium]|nr:hypothetical protein [bacterium]
ITFTLSEPSTNFAIGDAVASGGTLSNFSGSGTSYTATFTPAAGSTANGTVTVNASTFTDAVGNGNTAGSLANPIAIDTVAPTVTITSSASTLRSGQTATITFTLSEVSTNFTLGDVVATGGTLSNFTGSGTAYTATFTPTANSAATGNVSVAAGVFTDAAGNGNLTGALTVPIIIDTLAPAAPTLALGSGISDPVNRAEATQTGGLATVTGEAGATITVTFSRGTASVTKTLTGTGGPQAVVLTDADLATLGDGPVTVFASQSDVAGNTSVAAQPLAITIDGTAPAILRFESPTPDGTYGIGDAIVITAVVSEPIQAGSTMTVTLSTGAQVTLVAAAAGSSLSGTYVVQPGQNATDLDVVAAGGINVRDLAGNAVAGAAGGLTTLAATRAIAVGGQVRVLTPTGFGSTASAVPDRKTVTAIPIAFNTPVSGLSLASLRLRFGSRIISLRTATLTGSGASYVLSLPSKLTRLRGIYTLEIAATGISAANGTRMSQDATIYWGNGKSVAAATAPASRTTAATTTKSSFSWR